MQLARNLFLNQDKNLFRKIEECLITFVMEQPGLFTKEKILESYLTIAEWGPGISGIVNASQFYFGKAVSELTYDEAIFLALLLPNPKQYKTLFDKNGKLKESFLVVMEGLRFSMWEHGFLPDTEFEKEISLRLK